MPSCTAELDQKSTPPATGAAVTLKVAAEHQLKSVTVEGLAAVLKTYRGKGILVNVWSST